MLGLPSALNDLLAALAEHQSRILISHDTVQGWEQGVLDELIKKGLLKKAPTAASLECRGCEEHCFSDVLVRTEGDTTRAHIVCEVPERQAQMGLVNVPLSRLQQWQSSPAQLAGFVATALTLDTAISSSKEGVFHLGMLPGPHGRRGIALSMVSFSLEVNQQSIPLAELLFTEQGAVTVDRCRIDSAMSLKVNPRGKGYQPNTDKRESRKLATAAMRQDWRDAHEQLQREHPDKSKKWYSLRIARLPIAQGRDSETIRRQL